MNSFKNGGVSMETHVIKYSGSWASGLDDPSPYGRLKHSKSFQRRSSWKNGLAKGQRESSKNPAETLLKVQYLIRRWNEQDPVPEDEVTLRLKALLRSRDKYVDGLKLISGKGPLIQRLQTLIGNHRQLAQENAQLLKEKSATRREIKQLKQENHALKKKESATRRKIEKLERENRALRKKKPAHRRKIKKLEPKTQDCDLPKATLLRMKEEHMRGHKKPN